MSLYSGMGDVDDYELSSCVEPWGQEEAILYTVIVESSRIHGRHSCHMFDSRNDEDLAQIKEVHSAKVRE